MRKLTVDDIVDLRAYERERADFRQRIIELKRTRRVALGPILTILFENTETMRWQVQEMARAERMLRDEQIAHEVETYNELIPDAGELSGTLFLELTSDEALREWLPKLVGIEFHIAIELPDGSRAGQALRRRRGTPDARRHDGGGALPALRVHARAGRGVREGPVRVVVDHPEYQYETTLDAAQHAALAAGSRGSHGSHVTSPPDAHPDPPARSRPAAAGRATRRRRGARPLRRRRRDARTARRTALVPTGIAIAIPPGYAGFVQPRSGLALRHGVTVVNTPGLVDAGYRDEIRVLLVNLDPAGAVQGQPGAIASRSS